jgi:hypothetical protein
MRRKLATLSSSSMPKAPATVPSRLRRVPPTRLASVAASAWSGWCQKHMSLSTIGVAPQAEPSFFRAMQ